MPSVAAVSSGEILDMVAAPPAPRGDSGSSRDRFEDVLAGASQELGSEGVVPASSQVQPAKSKEPQEEVTPAKPQGPEKSASQPGNANDSATSNGKEPAPAASEGSSGAPGKHAGEGEGTAAASATEDEEAVPSQVEAVLFLSQLVVSAVYGPPQLTGGAPAEPGDENGLKLGAPALIAEQSPSDPNLTLLAADLGLPQEDWEDWTGGQAPTTPQAVEEALGLALAGAVFTEEGEETALATIQADTADEAPEAAPQLVALAGEDLSALAEEGDLPPGAAPLLDDGSLPEEGVRAVPARDARAIFTETSPEEAAGETAVQPTPAPVNDGEELTRGARQVDWSRWTDAEGEDAPRQAVQTPAPTAPATAFAGEGDFGQPAEGDGPGGNHLAGKQTVAGQAASDAQSQSKAAPAAAPASQPMDHLVRAEIHRQVMEAALSRMSIAVREGVAQARIQLDPPSLGRMHMELRMQDGAMNAKVTVETSLARDTVMSGLRELKESLLRQGVSLESFSVDVRVNLNAGSFGQDRTANQGDGAFYLEAVPDDETAAQASERPIFASSSLSGDGSINIFA